MGCCKTKIFRNVFNKENKILADKRSQVSRLNEVLKKIEYEIKKLNEV